MKKKVKPTFEKLVKRRGKPLKDRKFRVDSTWVRVVMFSCQCWWVEIGKHTKYVACPSHGGKGFDSSQYFVPPEKIAKHERKHPNQRTIFEAINDKRRV